MPASTGFEFRFGRTGTVREPDAPLRLLVLADLRGGAAADRPPLAERPTIRLDLDNFDAVIARLAPRLATEVGEVRISGLDDFHPDALFGKLELFGALREARARPVPQGADSPLAALLGGSPVATPRKTPQDGIEALLQRVVAPHIVPDTRVQTQAYLGAIDAAIAEQMRQLLHAPAFQGLEATWRGLHWLVSRLELDESLQLHLLDVSREELLADLDPARGLALEQTASHTAIVNRARKQPGEQGWSALIGLHPFGPAPDQMQLLAALGALGSQAGGPFIAAADPALWRRADEHTSWNALRGSEAARWIGLVAPRMLLRSPYGARNEPVDAFAFEELLDASVHEHYLWASGALAFALLLGRSYSLNQGWSFSLGDEREIDDLPSCTRPDRDGEPELVPCAEFFLSDQDAEGLLAAGFMPLLSHRHSNVAMLMRCQSVAAPAASLHGLPA